MSSRQNQTIMGFKKESGNPLVADPFVPTLLEERGRKRRRPSDDLTAQPVAHNPSGESTTLRGRGRRRSTSGESSQSDGANKHRIRTMSPPVRKYQKTLLLELTRKKRSQSPSRSRSRDRDRTPQRRRQRTTSRSRIHQAEKGGLQGPKQDESGKGEKSGFEVGNLMTVASGNDCV